MRVGGAESPRPGLRAALFSFQFLEGWHQRPAVGMLGACGWEGAGCPHTQRTPRQVASGTGLGLRAHPPCAQATASLSESQVSGLRGRQHRETEALPKHLVGSCSFWDSSLSATAGLSQPEQSRNPPPQTSVRRLRGRVGTPASHGSETAAFQADHPQVGAWLPTPALGAPGSPLDSYLEYLQLQLGGMESQELGGGGFPLGWVTLPGCSF